MTLSPFDFGGEGDGGPVGHEDEEAGRGAESSSGDAVMAGPAAVVILDAVQVSGDFFVPFDPVLAALDDETFADVHVTEEFLAAVGPEAGDESGVIQFFDDRVLCRLELSFVFVESIQGFFGCYGIIKLKPIGSENCVGLFFVYWYKFNPFQ